MGAAGSAGRRASGSAIGEYPAGHRVGVIVPYDFALDREIWRWAPDELSLAVTRTRRLLLPASVEMAEQISTEETLRAGTRDLLAADPEALLYLCTSGSFVRGLAGERRMREVLVDGGAPAAVTTSGALLDALAHLGVQDVAVASPYVADVGAHLASFLAEAGVRVHANRGLGLVEGIWRVPHRTVYDLVLDSDHDRAGAVFISCTNLPTYDVIAPLEAVLGKPVVSANQVSLWAAMRLVGVRPPASGQRLFSAVPPVSPPVSPHADPPG